MTATEVVAPFLGAAIIEVIHWHQLRMKLHLKKYRALMRSAVYWGWTAAMIVFGGLGTLFLFGDILTHGQLLIAGAAFPAVFTKFVSAFKKQHVTYGDDDPATDAVDDSVSIGDFFLVS